MYKGRYTIDDAVIDSAKAAYLATLIECEIMGKEMYSGNPFEVKDMIIQPVLTNRLNRLKVYLPEAYYYWSKISELLSI